ncbi:hypothetical protein [Radiobacillus deserti]|uniref:Uncharacterized protein n=1 Tax=Radiobacillus deserti TaxID=2594883 RepID=A0A516KII5_9BACI|nr:hypothetical protein [Radiobacillus deserti]QDP41199.1 hypothetical protein FN924_14015 [Radiobacillus deserti]
MVCATKSQRIPVLFLFMLWVLLMIIVTSSLFKIFFLLLAVCTFLQLFIQFKIRISDSLLQYQVFFFTLPIVNKKLLFNHIKWIRLTKGRHCK